VQPLQPIAVTTTAVVTRRSAAETTRVAYSQQSSSIGIKHVLFFFKKTRSISTYFIFA